MITVICANFTLSSVIVKWRKLEYNTIGTEDLRERYAVSKTTQLCL